MKLFSIGLLIGALLYAIYVLGYIRGLRKSTQLHSVMFDETYHEVNEVN